MVASNPFSLSFGIEPVQYIARSSEKNEIIDSFMSDNPSTHMFMISGVRGAGKTVMLSNLSDTFESHKDWIVLNVSADTDILTAIAAKLYSKNDCKKLFLSAKLDLSVFGIGLSIEKGNQIFDMETALERMLTELSKKGKKVLIAIDEIVNNEHVRLFASSFQILIRKKLPLFLIMTGLYENIRNLQNEKTLTFLYRAPSIILEPLRISSIARSYESILGIDNEKALYMSKLTKGYAFAYQVLGYLYYKNYIAKKGSGDVDALLPSYDELLEEYSYEKIWHELSEKEKEVVAQLADCESKKVSEVIAALGISSGSMSVYRDRLNRKGILDVTKYGYLSLKLPRFGEIISVWL